LRATLQTPASGAANACLLGGSTTPRGKAADGGRRTESDARGVPAGMTARWGAARRGPADDGVACPARRARRMTARCARPVGAHASPMRGAFPSPAWRARESRAQRVPITAGRVRESRARESGRRQGVPGGWRAFCHAPGLLTRRCSGRRWRGSWAGRDSGTCRRSSSTALHTPASGAANRHVRRPGHYSTRNTVYTVCL